MKVGIEGAAEGEARAVIVKPEVAQTERFMQFKKMLIKMSQELNVHPMPGNLAAHASPPPLSGTVTGTPPLPTLPLFLHRIIKNQYQKLICSYIATSSDIHEAQPTLCGMTGRG